LGWYRFIGVVMDFSLKPEHEQIIQECLDIGDYENADEVLSDALHLLKLRNRQHVLSSVQDDSPEAMLEMVDGVLVVKSQGQKLSGDLVAAMREERVRQLANRAVSSVNAKLRISSWIFPNLSPLPLRPFSQPLT
jgi:Arc/MetJ-type ribon-helix-helix transcriptional regulator